MLKHHGDAILPDEKRYFNHRNSGARLVTEGTLGRLKIKLKVLFRKCKSNKETLKLHGLVCVVLHNLCLESGDLFPRKFDLTTDHASNRRLSPGEVMDVLALGSTNKKNFEVNKKSEALKVQKAFTAKMWKENKDSMWIQIQHSLMFFSLSNQNASCILLYYCKCNFTILLLHMCAIFRCSDKIKICLTENLGY